MNLAVMKGKRQYQVWFKDFEPTTPCNHREMYVGLTKEELKELYKAIEAVL